MWLVDPSTLRQLIRGSSNVMGHRLFLPIYPL